MENVVWAEKAPSGTYRVQVHYFDYAERRTPVPFTVRVTVGGERKEYREARLVSRISSSSLSVAMFPSVL